MVNDYLEKGYSATIMIYIQSFSTGDAWGERCRVGGHLQPEVSDSNRQY